MATKRDDEDDNLGMHVMPEPMMVLAAILLIAKAIRHPRRAIRRAREIAREIKQGVG